MCGDKFRLKNSLYMHMKRKGHLTGYSVPREDMDQSGSKIYLQRRRRKSDGTLSDTAQPPTEVAPPLSQAVEIGHSHPTASGNNVDSHPEGSSVLLSPAAPVKESPSVERGEGLGHSATQDRDGTDTLYSGLQTLVVEGSESESGAAPCVVPPTESPKRPCTGEQQEQAADASVDLLKFSLASDSTGERTFRCSTCLKVYHKRNSLYVHQQRKGHKEGFTVGTPISNGSSSNTEGEPDTNKPSVLSPPVTCSASLMAVSPSSAPLVTASPSRTLLAVTTPSSALRAAVSPSKPLRRVASPNRTPQKVVLPPNIAPRRVVLPSNMPQVAASPKSVLQVTYSTSPAAAPLTAVSIPSEPQVYLTTGPQPVVITPQTSSITPPALSTRTIAMVSVTPQAVSKEPQNLSARHQSVDMGPQAVNTGAQIVKMGPQAVNAGAQVVNVRPQAVDGRPQSLSVKHLAVSGGAQFLASPLLLQSDYLSRGNASGVAGGSSVRGEANSTAIHPHSSTKGDTSSGGPPASKKQRLPDPALGGGGKEGKEGSSASASALVLQLPRGQQSSNECQCGMVFPDHSSLEAHERKYHSRPVVGYKCRVCGKVYLVKNSLTVHQKRKRHSGWTVVRTDAGVVGKEVLNGGAVSSTNAAAAPGGACPSGGGIPSAVPRTVAPVQAVFDSSPSPVSTPSPGGGSGTGYVVVPVLVPSDHRLAILAGSHATPIALLPPSPEQQRKACREVSDEGEQSSSKRLKPVGTVDVGCQTECLPENLSPCSSDSGSFVQAAGGFPSPSDLVGVLDLGTQTEWHDLHNVDDLLDFGTQTPAFLHLTEQGSQTSCLDVDLGIQTDSTEGLISHIT